MVIFSYPSIILILSGTFDLRLPSAASVCNWFWVKCTDQELGIPMKIVHKYETENSISKHVHEEIV